MKTALLILQLITSVALITVILLQSKGSGLSSAFGGGGGVYRSKRGVEKLFVYLTVILAVVFLVLSLLQVII
jgi:preprotein translocase subunit SecG